MILKVTIQITKTYIYSPRRKRSLRRFCFYTCLYVHEGWYSNMHCRWYPSMPCSRSLGGGYPSMPCRFPGSHPRGKLRGLAWRVSRPTPRGGVSRPTPSEHALRQTPPLDGYCCGRYISNWNAFLYDIKMIRHNLSAKMLIMKNVIKVV